MIVWDSWSHGEAKDTLGPNKFKGWLHFSFIVRILSCYIQLMHWSVYIEFPLDDDFMKH